MATNNKNTADKMKACSVRLPQGLLATLHAEAERKGTTLGDVIRNACAAFRDQQALDERLAQLENRFFRKVFEAQCAVADLTDTERNEAMQVIKRRIQGGQA